MTRRIAIAVCGVVQGVGFRPFIYLLAHERKLAGWVQNTGDAVHIEIEGDAGLLEGFLTAIRREAPPHARVEQVDVTEIEPRGETVFRIVESKAALRVRAVIPADLATCSECAAEIATPGERRYRYPFTNCTHCGPRFTIIESVPYDRPRTSMKDFPLCPACEAEYRNPLDRRFHAQPIACPNCGPELRVLLPDGSEQARGAPALQRAVASLVAGRILALKGLGGFQLLVDATNSEAVARLRLRKQREAKPFAVMFPSLEELRACCEVSAAEEKMLTSSEAPIVLLRRRFVQEKQEFALSEAVAPGNPYVGAMLPYTPLHRLLLEACRRPLVCSSGNVSEEPMCIDNDEAVARLGAIADELLVHNRPIIRPMDDSVGRMGARGFELWRRARGFAPLPLRLSEGDKGPAVLALGGQLKATITLLKDGAAIVSQHLGDLHSVEGARLLERTVRDFMHFFDFSPALLACDLHPDYASTRLGQRLAQELGCELELVQHHHAHAASVMAEHGLEGKVLGLSWDGTGLGTDGAVWGGEWLACEGANFTRVAHVRPFRLPGGEQAVREPRRAALGLLYAFDPALAERWAAKWFKPAEVRVLLALLARGPNAPWTTSMGRLFDAVAALIGLRGHNHFEGQAAMELEFAAYGADKSADNVGAYELALNADGASTALVVDWAPLLGQLMDDVQRGTESSLISARFHRGIVQVSVEVARRSALGRVVLGGGCWQNRLLALGMRASLEKAGFEVWTPERVPTNDGGLSLGQALIASRRYKERSHVPCGSR